MSLYGTKMKLELRAARARVRVRFHGEGSVLAETVRSSCESVEATLEIDSDEDPAKIAKLARVSEAGCFVIQTIRRPTPVSYGVLLNGRELRIDG